MSASRFNSSTHTFTFEPSPDGENCDVIVNGFRRKWSWRRFQWEFIEDNQRFTSMDGRWFRDLGNGFGEPIHGEDTQWLCEQSEKWSSLQQASSQSIEIQDGDILKEPLSEDDRRLWLQNELNKISKYCIYLGRCEDGVLEITIAGGGLEVQTELHAEVVNTFENPKIWERLVENIRAIEGSLDAAMAQIPSG